MNGNNFLLRVMQFVKCWSYVISHYRVKFGVHRTFGIGDITIFVCHKTTYNHDQRIMRLCAWWPNTINHHFAGFGSHEPFENRDETFFIHHATIVSCDHLGWSLLVSHHHFKFSRIWPRESWNITVCCLSRDLIWPREQKNM